MEHNTYIVLYAKGTEVLTVIFRVRNKKFFCKLQGDVKPLPIKGEFETPNIAMVDKFLSENGWHVLRKFGTTLSE